MLLHLTKKGKIQVKYEFIRELSQRSKNELKIEKDKDNSLQRIACDQQRLFYRNRRTYYITKDEEGEARGGNYENPEFFIQDRNMVRHD